jgi:hypothetical protein
VLFWHHMQHDTAASAFCCTATAASCNSS